MKYIKKFENVSKPKIGDYVIGEINNIHSSDMLKNYIKNSIGEITFIFREDRVISRYFDIPKNLKRNFYDGQNNDQIVIYTNKIVGFGTKEEMELILNSKKYNL